MKKIFFILLIIFAHSEVFAQTEGIQFFQGDWNSLLAEAKKTNKPFFVDFYTTWCGPCKLMAKKTFADAGVGKYSKGKFVAYQIDAEKGEGLNLANQYKIRAYPTIVFFNAKGEKIGEEIGYKDADNFLYVLEKYNKKK